MIIRDKEIQTVQELLHEFPVVGIIGARQVGKTTLARQVIEHSADESAVFDLENPEDMARLADPMLALKHLHGLIVIDEIQRMPELFPVLRVLADRPDSPATFLILGSASPQLLRQGSETLAGRIVYHELGGFHLHEVGPDQWRKLWLRGAFPRSFLSRTLKTSVEWRRGFIRTFLERDIPQLGININSTTLRTFWTMLAHYHGQVWNASEIGRSFGVAHTTIKHYLDTLTSALVVRQLQPWYENISKRQVKSAKIFIVDSGLLHTLLNIQTVADLEGHPKIGASWEGFVIEQLVRHLDVDFMDCYFWATHSGAELDLLILRGQRRFGFEIKRTSSPKLTASMNSALTSLTLNHLYVIHAGDHSFPLADRVDALSFDTMFQNIRID
jgi:hypothetical protein